MPANDIKVIRDPYGVQNYAVDDRTTSTAVATWKAGEPVKRATDFAAILLTGDPEIGTDIFLGICAAESTETASADGTVDVTVVGPGTILRGTASTTTNINTAAKLLAYRNNSVCFDGPAAITTSPRTAYTIEESETDDPNVHGLYIVNGDIERYTLDCYVNVLVTQFGSIVGQTMD